MEVDDYKSWTPEIQQRALEMLKATQVKAYRPFYCTKKPCDGLPHDDWTWNHARSTQHPPDPKGDWFVWLVKSGRGTGKTRSGSEYTHRVAKVVPRINLIAPTGAAVRDVMVEGESGILATSPPGQMPQWEPSKRRLTWPNGAIASTFSAEEPDRLRGPQGGWAWLDEPAHMPLIEDVWSNLLLGLRLGKRPRICCTTTPTPTAWLKALAADPLTVVTSESTYANLANLADSFRRTVLSRYEGTRLGRQELYGEILEDVEGAHWNYDMFVYVEKAPPLERIVVAVDPAGSSSKGSDETGIIVIGKAGTDLYVLADGSGRYTPNQWASAAVSLAEHWSADAIVAEKNFGGEMVANTIRSISTAVRVLPVNSRRGKFLRAEPIVGLYEQKKIKHVGKFPGLEEQQTSWVPGVGDSPDRVDALVHGATELTKRGGGLAQIASPRLIRRRIIGA